MSGDDCVLLVEGLDDKHVVRHLSDRQEEMPNICIFDKDGIEGLLEDIGLELRVPGRRALGILVDANDDLNARWSAVADRLREENIVVPDNPGSEGTIINGFPRVGIWLMPDNQSPGELEDFVSKMIPDEDPIWPRARRYIDCIPKADRKFTEKKIQRARIHAWLATREDPRRMGAAIGARDLSVDGAYSTKFVEWLRRLFQQSDGLRNDPC